MIQGITPESKPVKIKSVCRVQPNCCQRMLIMLGKDQIFFVYLILKCTQYFEVKKF